MDTAKTLLPSGTQPVEMRESDNRSMSGGGVALNLNPERFLQNKRTDANGSQFGRVMPENATLLIYYPRVPTPSAITLNLSRERLAYELQKFTHTENVDFQVGDMTVDYSWPLNLARAAYMASGSIFERVWNSPEEDEAWRDL